MEPQERDLITTLLTRLQSAGGQPKDPEADALIRQAMTQMPDAPYFLVQTVLIQDLSLHNAQNRIATLEQQLATQTAPAPRTSFLGGLLGGGSQAQPQASVPSGGPWTRAPQAAPPPQYAQPGYPPSGYAQPAASPMGGMFGGGGNSFLRSAATTAAGVAGGALLFEGISSLFGHGFAGGLGGMGGMGMGGMGMGGGLGETVINNYGGGGQGGAGSDDYSAGGAGGGGYDGGAGAGGYDGGGSGGGYDGGGGGGDGGGYDGDGGGFDGGGGGGDGGGSSSC